MSIGAMLSFFDTLEVESGMGVEDALGPFRKSSSGRERSIMWNSLSSLLLTLGLSPAGPAYVAPQLGEVLCREVHLESMIGKGVNL